MMNESQTAAPQTDTDSATTSDVNTETTVAQAQDSAQPAGGSLLGNPEPSPQGEIQPQANEPVQAEPVTFTADDFAIPEGQQVDQEMMQEFLTFAGDKHLGKEEAQALLNMHARVNAKNMEQWRHTQNSWMQEIQSDKEYGGAKFESTVKEATRALRAYDTSGALLAELQQTGMERNPRLLRFLSNIGRSISEDGLVTSREPGGVKEEPLADRLWPDMK